MSYVPSISDEAALAKTGKNWSAWFRVLDRWGARKKSHPEIAKHLAAEHGLSGWWSQMVTVEFEKARGMRAAVGDRAARGFEVSVQRTVPLSAAETYALLATSRGLKRWLGKEASIQPRKNGHVLFPRAGEGRIRIIEKNKRIRMGLEGRGISGSILEITLAARGRDRCAGLEGRGISGSILEITLAARGRDRCAVRVQHGNIPSEAAFKRFRKRWTEDLDSLRDLAQGAGR